MTPTKFRNTLLEVEIESGILKCTLKERDGG